MATENGTFSYNPTTSGIYTWSFRMKNSGTLAQPASVYYLDNLQVSYPYPYTRIDCEKGQNASYRYGFNGKEKESDLYGNGDAYDFGARIYVGRIGRWVSVDPLWHKYLSHSPYSYAKNNPIVNIDIEGESVWGYVELFKFKPKIEEANLVLNNSTTFQKLYKVMEKSNTVVNFMCIELPKQQSNVGAVTSVFVKLANGKVIDGKQYNGDGSDIQGFQINVTINGAFNKNFQVNAFYQAVILNHEISMHVVPLLKILDDNSKTFTERYNMAAAKDPEKHHSLALDNLNSDFNKINDEITTILLGMEDANSQEFQKVFHENAVNYHEIETGEKIIKTPNKSGANAYIGAVSTHNNQYGKGNSLETKTTTFNPSKK